MMTSSNSPSAPITVPIYTPEFLPVFKENDQDEIGSQIAHYFRQVLESREIPLASRGWVKLPDITNLTQHFHCSELDIIAAFDLLRKQGYYCHIQSLDRPVLLKDPLQRRPCNLTCRHKLAEQMKKPFQALLPSSKSRQKPGCSCHSQSNRKDRA